MKANEAPEKIYIDVSLDSAWGMSERSYDNEVEYTRTNTFIEKACEWLGKFLDESTLIEYKVTPIVKKAVIDNFRKIIEE